MSEDCLYLNVWTPNVSADLPVYLWMYGGRFIEESGDVSTYDGPGLAAQDIVMVTMNYRLGALVTCPILSSLKNHHITFLATTALRI